jgi:hypothetical protein
VAEEEQEEEATAGLRMVRTDSQDSRQPVRRRHSEARAIGKAWGQPGGLRRWADDSSLVGRLAQSPVEF